MAEPAEGAARDLACTADRTAEPEREQGGEDYRSEQLPQADDDKPDHERPPLVACRKRLCSSTAIIPKRGARCRNLGENAVSANATRRLPQPLTTSSAGISSENSVPVPAVGSTESVQALTARSDRVRARPTLERTGLSCSPSLSTPSRNTTKRSPRSVPLSAPSRTWTAMLPSSSLCADRITEPPTGVWSMALARRLSSACPSEARSARTRGNCSEMALRTKTRPPAACDLTRSMHESSSGPSSTSAGCGA